MRSVTSRYGVIFSGFLSLLLLVACAQAPQTQPVAFTITPPERLQFSGKGSGAGMMLMSALGPAGIAIGVAIDEGIAKDIAATAKAGGVDVVLLLEQQLKAQWLALTPAQQKGFRQHLPTLAIEHYGFITQPGENDPVIAKLQLRLLAEGAPFNNRLIRYPDDFKALKASLATAPLDRVKTDAAAITALVEEAAVYIAKAALMAPSTALAK